MPSALPFSSVLHVHEFGKEGRERCRFEATSGATDKSKSSVQQRAYIRRLPGEGE